MTCIHGCHRSGKSQGKKIIFSRLGKSQGIFNLDKENGNFEKSEGKLTIIRERFCEQGIWRTPVFSYFSAVILFKK